jgi:transcriptional regulator with XRE-family HTH domain
MGRGGVNEEGKAVSGSDATVDLEREILEESEDTAYAYLAQSWLTSAIDRLWDARRQAGLTQAEVAQRLNTKQPAIARLEKDSEGSLSLRRYVEYALACGVLPLDISLKPAAALRQYALGDPEAPRTESAYKAWSMDVPVQGNVTAPITFSIHEQLPRVEPRVDLSALYAGLEEYEPSYKDLRKLASLCMKFEEPVSTYATLEGVWETVLQAQTVAEGLKATVGVKPRHNYTLKHARTLQPESAAA